jgi:hypothetical protein
MDRMQSMLNELWAVVGALQAGAAGAGGKNTESGKWKVVDEEGLRNLTKVCSLLPYLDHGC